MGSSSSSNRRQNNDNNYGYNQHQSHQLNPSSSSSSSSESHFQSSGVHNHNPSTSNSNSNSNPNSSNLNYMYPPPPLPSQQAPNMYPNHAFPPNYSFSCYSNGYSNYNSNSPGYGNQQAMVNRSNYPPYYANNNNNNNNQITGWSNAWPAVVLPVQPVVIPAPYVEHQNAKKVRNDVNVHKDTLRIEVDEQNPDQLLISFVFDAVFDGSITLYYFAKEEPGCKFLPLFPEGYKPVRIPFQKGPGQKFRQPSGTGVDLGFFELDDLAKPSPEEDVFPLVIAAETCPVLDATDATDKFPNMQITQAVLEKSNSDPFRVKVIRQLLWVDAVRYELREIYGIGSSTQDYSDSDPGKECVICMTDPKDTAVLPCRHMCMCSECAKELRLQSDKCPICRQPIEELLEIKINNSDL